MFYSYTFINNYTNRVNGTLLVVDLYFCRIILTKTTMIILDCMELTCGVADHIKLIDGKTSNTGEKICNIAIDKGRQETFRQREK